MIRDDGAVKVLDFGLAKLMEVDEEDARPPTVADVSRESANASSRAAGTAAYMAENSGRRQGRYPQRHLQLRRHAADGYGTRPFKGGSAVEHSSRPAVGANAATANRADLPRDLERLILRCLRKDLDRRCQTMLDVRNELLEIDRPESRSRAALGCCGTPIPDRIINSRWGDSAARRGGVGLVAAAECGCATDARAPGHEPRGREMMPTFSPDGAHVAFAWEGDRRSGNVDIYVALIGSPTVRRLTTDPAMDVFPSWSPDGRHLAFVRQLTDHAGRVYSSRRSAAIEPKSMTSMCISIASSHSARSPGRPTAVHRGGGIDHPEARREHRRLSPPWCRAASRVW